MKARLTTKALDGLDELEQLATRGPWRAGSVETDAVFIRYDEGLAGPGGERVLLRANKNFEHAADVKLIAEARNALRPLLDEVKRLRARQVEILRRAQQAESALREKVRAVAGPHDSRGLGRRMLGGVLTMVEADVERLRDVLSRLVERADPSGPTSSELLQEARRVLEETGTNPVERATDHFRRGEKHTIADVRAYLREEMTRFNGGGDHDAEALCSVLIDALERGDHEGAARRAGGRS